MQRMQETERRSALTFQSDKHSKGENGKRKQSLRNRESDNYQPINYCSTTMTIYKPYSLHRKNKLYIDQPNNRKRK